MQIDSPLIAYKIQAVLFWFSVNVFFIPDKIHF